MVQIEIDEFIGAGCWECGEPVDGGGGVLVIDPDVTMTEGEGWTANNPGAQRHAGKGD